MPAIDLRRARKMFLLVPLAVLGLLVLAFTAFQLRIRAQIRDYEARARARKEPLTLRTLAAAHYAAIPDHENAAVPLLALWETEHPEYWRAFRQGSRKLPEKPDAPSIPFPKVNDRVEADSGEASAESLQPLVSHVAARSDYREAVREALRRPGCRFPVRVTDGLFALLPHLARLKRDATEFRAEAWVATERGDVEASVRAIRDCAQIGHLLREDPVLIGQLVRIACYSMCLSDVERLLSRLPPNETQLGELRAVTEGLSALDGYRRGMMFERAVGLGLFETSLSALWKWVTSAQWGDEVAGFPEEMIMIMLRLSGLDSLDRRLYMETFEHLLTNAPLDTPAQLLAVETAMTNTVIRGRQFPPKPFCGMLLPALENGARKFCQLEALRDAALAALAVERYRLIHAGRLPEALTELVPDLLAEVPRDPFDGQPLRYHRLKEGYVVYSVGPDRIDHGGREKPKKGGTSQFDVTFTVRR